MRQFSSIACVVSLLAGVGVASATQINVAILSATGNAAYDTAVVAKIQPDAPLLNISVWNVSTSTPTVAMLDAYQAVMVIGGNGMFLDAATLGTNLKQYIDQGHGVVMTALSNIYSNCSSTTTTQLCGAFQAADYWAIEPAVLNNNNRATLGHIYLPDDPLLAGVTTFDGGSISDRINGGVHAGATRVADWSDGTPLLVTRTFASGATEVAVNFFPPSSEQFTGLWVASTDGGKILANAFYEAADLPEPATYFLAGTGLGLMYLMLRRRRTTLQCESAQRPRQH
jgi:hypothetical protein